MAIEEEEAVGVPEWVVTFGDMMSLLLTFFIMLVSLSEVKQEEKYQAIVESFRRQFGHQASMVSAIPGTMKPRNSNLAKLASMGRSRRLDVMRGGDKVKAPVGDHPRVIIVRPGMQTGVGTVIFFEEGSAELSEQNKRHLEVQAAAMGGEPQKIEVRGHTSLKPVAPNSKYRDNGDLAYQRSRNTAEYLIELGIQRRRIRIAVAGSHEPFHLGTDPVKMKQNPRVEIFLLDEVVEDLVGTEEEKEQRFEEPDASEE